MREADEGRNSHERIGLWDAAALCNALSSCTIGQQKLLPGEKRELRANLYLDKSITMGNQAAEKQIRQIKTNCFWFERPTTVEFNTNHTANFYGFSSNTVIWKPQPQILYVLIMWKQWQPTNK